MKTYITEATTFLLAESVTAELKYTPNPVP
jgi:hypothetical protein